MHYEYAKKFKEKRFDSSSEASESQNLWKKKDFWLIGVIVSIFSDNVAFITKNNRIGHKFISCWTVFNVLVYEIFIVNFCEQFLWTFKCFHGLEFETIQQQQTSLSNRLFEGINADFLKKCALIRHQNSRKIPYFPVIVASSCYLSTISESLWKLQGSKQFEPTQLSH